MGGALIMAILIGIVALIASVRGDAAILGMGGEQFAVLAWCAALGILALGWVGDLLRGHGARAFAAIVFWVALAASLMGLYRWRAEIGSLTDRLLYDATGASTDTAAGGEVTVSRRSGDSFLVAGSINGRNARFLFDTGATTVVLTSETARTVGIDLGKLRYTHPVTTANGRTLAASVTLDQVTVGGISEARVLALVAQPGGLFENLLGMTFLNRLASYEVRGDRLTMRGRDAGKAADGRR